MRTVIVSTLILFSISLSANSQTLPEIFNNQMIVSPKGLETLPLSSSGGTTRLSSTSPVFPLATTVQPFTDAELRAISQAAGIYIAANPGSICPPGPISCKPSPITPEQINLVDRGPAGDVSRILEVTSTSVGAIDRTIAAINASPAREAVPNYWRRTTQVQEPQYYLQWGFANRSTTLGGANLIGAWTQTLGANSTNVAVIDTGTLRSHPDVGPALIGGIDLVTIPLLAGDGDGADLDASDPGDFVDANVQNILRFYGVSCNASNSSWHGTHVAGTIAGRVNGQFGVGGAPNVRIVPIRVLGKCGGDDRAILDGIAWAMGLPVQGLPANPNPAHVINMSLGGPSPCNANYRRLFAEARRRNIFVVVSAGNDNRNTNGYAPAGCPDVISVAAHDRNGIKATFSNYGSNVLISAPGVSILSAVDFGTTFSIGPTTKEFSGTSMAAPHVSAAIALLRSARPSVTYDQVVQYLRTSANAFLSGSGCAAAELRAGQCGAGLLDADRLLSTAGVGSVVAPPATQPPVPTPAPSEQKASGCFIATAAYGTPLAKEVQVLRRFRDNVLLQSSIGRSFVDWYYAVSPAVANRIEGSEVQKSVVRAILTPLIAIIESPVDSVLIFVTVVLTTTSIKKRYFANPLGLGIGRRKKTGLLASSIAMDA